MILTQEDEGGRVTAKVDEQQVRPSYEGGKVEQLVRTLYEREKVIFNTFVDFWRMERLKNRNGVRQLRSIDNSTTKRFLNVGSYEIAE